MKIFKEIKSYLLITFGLLLYTGGWVVFLIPNHLVGGGVSGVGVLIYYATGFPVSYTFFMVNAVLLLIALKILGRGFGIKTVYAIVVAALCFQLLPQWIPADLIHELAIENGKLLAALIGGVMGGAGIGITFSQGGSTGGTDIIALIISKYRNISPGRLILAIDVVIISCSFFTSEETNLGLRLATVLYGFILIGVTGYMIDLMIAGTKQSLQILIFSKNYQQIADRLTKEMNRGVTLISGQGWFTKKESKVVMVIVRRSEAGIAYRIVKEEDKDAFLSVANVTGVYGKGFDRIKE
ncbi:MAG: YitT family protein [Bacteroidales bacterium]|nr:YitT family protein [Bacteroidales bacterium]